MNELQVLKTKIQCGKMALQMWRGAEHNQRHLDCQTNPLKHLYHSMVNNLFTLTNVQHLACTSQSEPEHSARQPVSVPEIGLLGNRFIRFISGSVCFVTRLNVISGSVFYYNKGFYPSFHNVSDSVPGAEDGGEHKERDRVVFIIHHATNKPVN
jgi:hypothetical protein